MFAYMIGTVAEADIDCCILEVNNVGYNISIPVSVYEKLPPAGEEVRLYTYTSIRENAIELIGFLDKDDLNMFKQLITVSGIGPKAALSLLSYMDANSIRIAIVTGDVKTLSKAQGLGKKSAERIIVDLKNKYDANAVLNAAQGAGGGASEASDKSGLTAAMSEAVDVLIALGFAESESKRAVMGAEVTDDMNVDEIINAALKLIR